MRQFTKTAEPKSLTQYRCLPGAEYDGPNFTPVKDDIRAKLIDEQGGVCAYCMSRISAQNMKVEHWECQDHVPRRQLDYANMLGCCKGNEGQKYAIQHCDTRKANLPLSFSPSLSSHGVNRKIKVRPDGRLYSEEQAVQDEIERVLNLNYSRLVGNRRAVISAVRNKLAKDQRTRTPAEIRRLISHYSTKRNGGYSEYYGAAISYLEAKI